eukprot:scaffold553980_cov38-Prasinocladus_malaysianus.AAC.2
MSAWSKDVIMHMSCQARMHNLNNVCTTWTAWHVVHDQYIMALPITDSYVSEYYSCNQSKP